MDGAISAKPDRRRIASMRAARGGVLVLATCIVLLAGGCVVTGPAEWVHNGFKVGPNYCRPPAPVAEQWIQADDPKVQNRHLKDWWQVFDDPILNALIDTAYRQNPNLRVAGARILQARAQRGVAIGSIFPQTVQARGLYAYGNVADSPLHLDFTNFNLSWEIDFWGRFRRGIESANASLDASVDNYDDALVTLFADTATNYVQYRVTQQRLKIARANVKIQEDILKLVEDQQRVGINKVTLLDVNQARTVLEQTRASIPALEIALGQANDTLSTLLGISPHDMESELGPGPDLGANPMPNTPDWVATGIPADLLRRRPDVRRAERQVAAQSAQIGIAEAALYPSLLVNGVLGHENTDVPPIFVSNGFLAFIIPNFRWNIANFGRIANNVRQQQARLLELIAAYQNQVLTAGREAQIALRGFLRSQDQAESQIKAVEAAREALSIGRDQYRVGTIPFNTVFNLATTQVIQQDNRALAQGNIALNLINVYRAIGGGWEFRFQQNGCQGNAMAAQPATSATPDAADAGQLPAPKPVAE
jgi:NodT family efflux transporter outer membrane factor (OMF) lipoprotein